MHPNGPPLANIVCVSVHLRIFSRRNYLEIYHLKLRNVSHRGGKSLADNVAYNTVNPASASICRTVAYRVGGTFQNEAGETKSFAAKKGVIHTELLLPNGELPVWARDRWTLWEEVAKVEKRVNSRYVKEFELNLLIELSPQERLDLARSFLRREVVERLGLPVEWPCIATAAGRSGS